LTGYGSYRHEENGAVFIQALCDVLSERGSWDDLLSMVTIVLRTVAVKEMVMKDAVKKTIEELSQMPCFTTQLVRKVYFPPKTPVSKPVKRCRLF